MRNALIVGIDYYEKITPLVGCSNDALLMKKCLESNLDLDKSNNFETYLKVATDQNSKISNRDLRNGLRKLFKNNDRDLEIALFYFSGHGYLNSETGNGYLITSECISGEDGFPMTEIVQIAKSSRANSKIIIIDSCHSGGIGNDIYDDELAVLSSGMTILSASRNTQYAVMEKGNSVFTRLLIDALDGGAANLLGEITPGSIYTHIDQSLGGFEQRPLFKTNVSKFINLRKVEPPLELENLKMIIRLFPKSNSKFALDPSFEPVRCGNEGSEVPPPNLDNVRKFRVLQKYNRVNLLIPVDVPHMWDAAMNSKSCKLTALGQHYWRLVKKGLI